MLEPLGLRLIDLYQRHYSPRKGYCCAHRALTGGRSCSQFARTAIGRAGMWPGLFLSARRLIDCKDAAKILAVEDKGPSPFEQQHFGQCATAVYEARKLCCGTMMGALQELGDGPSGGGGRNLPKDLRK